MACVDSTPPQHGTKRNAQDLPDFVVTKRIRALEPDVVNKIAAGEIIVAPVNALKELVENAVDAGSTSLEIIVKEGGLKLLQITDNGCGIERDDMAILCERHTTSKLTTFEDLHTMSTYGFRGEALASISHIAHLTVTTKRKASNCAYRAVYESCRMVPHKPGLAAEPRPTAGRDGTQITVEDLFFNMPTRRRAFRSASEEFSKILDVTGKYAIHCEGVAFSLKKHGDASTSLSTQAAASSIDCIRQIYGSSVANELIAFESKDQHLGFAAHGFASNANYQGKKIQLIVFVNHRLVDLRTMKKSIETAYSAFLPKGSHPFVYLNLEIEPQRVDVNVHPTKAYVGILNEEDILDMICGDIRSKLASMDATRTFMTQSLLPSSRTPITTTSTNAIDPAASTSTSKASSKPNENNLIRTDAKMRKITTMMPIASRPDSSLAVPADATEDMDYTYTDRQPILCRLLTVKELRNQVREDMHNNLTETFATHTFVGIVDERLRLAAIQGGVKLFLIDYGMVAAEYFYQIGLTDFGNFGTIRFDPAIRLDELLRLGAESEKSRGTSECEFDFEVEEVVRKVSSQLLARRAMLLEYFSLDITEDGNLQGIPILMKGYAPSLAKLPRFLIRLGPCVNWTKEKECFETFLRELAEFYVPEQLPPMSGPGADVGDENIDEAIRKRRDEVRHFVEVKLFPALKKRLVATTDMIKMGAVLEIADLKGLYRVFERC